MIDVQPPRHAVHHRRIIVDEQLHQHHKSQRDFRALLWKDIAHQLSQELVCQVESEPGEYVQEEVNQPYIGANSFTLSLVCVSEKEWMDRMTSAYRQGVQDGVHRGHLNHGQEMELRTAARAFLQAAGLDAPELGELDLPENERAALDRLRKALGEK